MTFTKRIVVYGCGCGDIFTLRLGKDPAPNCAVHTAAGILMDLTINHPAFNDPLEDQKALGRTTEEDVSS